MQVASLTGQPVQLVRQYDLFFDIDFTGLSFNGKVTVDLDTTGDVSLDAVGLQVKSVKHGNRNLQFKQTSNAVEIKTGKFGGPLDIEFNGKVSENFTGFYKASYGDGYILTTHLEAAQKVLDYYESYFGIPYQLPKLHQIAVPEFAYGAMENWGAITYREILMHVDQNTSVRAKKAVAGVIAHEIAHMWFGDLVTMKWWDDIWLNESFATFMGHHAVDQGYPQWNVWQDFVRTQTSGAMGRDGLRSTHPIEARVKNPEEIEELFDEISYGKGASILRMIEEYIGH